MLETSHPPTCSTEWRSVIWKVAMHWYVSECLMIRAGMLRSIAVLMSPGIFKGTKPSNLITNMWLNFSFVWNHLTLTLILVNTTAQPPLGTEEEVHGPPQGQISWRCLGKYLLFSSSFGNDCMTQVGLAQTFGNMEFMGVQYPQVSWLHERNTMPWMWKLLTRFHSRILIRRQWRESMSWVLELWTTSEKVRRTSWRGLLWADLMQPTGKWTVCDPSKPTTFLPRRRNSFQWNEIGTRVELNLIWGRFCSLPTFPAFENKQYPNLFLGVDFQMIFLTKRFFFQRWCRYIY